MKVRTYILYEVDLLFLSISDETSQLRRLGCLNETNETSHLSQ